LNFSCTIATCAGLCVILIRLPSGARGSIGGPAALRMHRSLSAKSVTVLNRNPGPSRRGLGGSRDVGSRPLGGSTISDVGSCPPRRAPSRIH
jgi:hypothetical protein